MQEFWFCGPEGDFSLTAATNGATAGEATHATAFLHRAPLWVDLRRRSA